MKSPLFDSLKQRYERRFVRLDQLVSYVKFGKITKLEFEEITGTIYSDMM